MQHEQSDNQYIDITTPSEAARMLAVTERFLQLDRSTRRKIPYVKIGRLVRYRRQDLVSYLAANVIGG